VKYGYKKLSKAMFTNFPEGTPKSHWGTFGQRTIVKVPRERTLPTSCDGGVLFFEHFRVI